MTFVIYSKTTFKNKIATLHLCLKMNIISSKKWTIKLISNFVCIITNRNFYILTLRMHRLTLSTIFWWHEVSFIFKWILHSPEALRSSVISPRYGLIFSRYCLIDMFSRPLLLHSMHLLLNTPLAFHGT